MLAASSAVTLRTEKALVKEGDVVLGTHTRNAGSTSSHNPSVITPVLVTHR